MYIIQEQIESIEDKYWFDRYKSSDYNLALEFLDNFKTKYPNNKFRIVEVFIYV